MSFNTEIGFKLSLTESARAFFDQGALSRILNEVLAEAANNAKSKAPVKTGALRDSIGHRVSGMTGSVFASVDYSVPVEFGHRTKSGSTISPRPFLGPAAEDAFKKLDQKIQQHAQRVLKK